MAPVSQSGLLLIAIAGMIAPVVGPNLSHYLTEFYNLRWTFYINIRIGTLGLLACYAILDEAGYLKKERADLLRQPLNFDNTSVWRSLVWLCLVGKSH